MSIEVKPSYTMPEEQKNWMDQQYQTTQPTQSTPFTHPQKRPTERDLDYIQITPKRNENEITNKPPEGKKKKRRVTFSEKPLMEREAMPYSIVQDLLHTKANITFGQLMNILPYKKDVKKALTPKRSRPIKKKTTGKQKDMIIGAALTHTPMICKGQVAMWVIDIIIDSGSSVSIISKAFADRIKRSPNKRSTRVITGIHGDKGGSLGIITDIPVHLGDVVISVEMEVIDTQAYTMVLGNDWLQKAKAKIEYSPPKLTISDGNRIAEIQCQNSTSNETWENEEDEDEEEEEEDEEEESSDEEEVDNIGLNSMCLVASENESPDHHYYRISPWGIDIDSESFSWEEYQFMNEKFNP